MGWKWKGQTSPPREPTRQTKTTRGEGRRGKKEGRRDLRGAHGASPSRRGGGGDPTRDHPTTDLYPQGTENGFFVANTAEGQPSRQGGTKVGGGDPGRGNGETRGDGRPQGGRGGRHPKGNKRRPGRRSGEGLSRRDAGEGSQKLGRGGGKRWPCLFRREKSPSRRGSPHARFPGSPRGLGPKRGGPRRRSSGP